MNNFVLWISDTIRYLLRRAFWQEMLRSYCILIFAFPIHIFTISIFAVSAVFQIQIISYLCCIFRIIRLKVSTPKISYLMWIRLMFILMMSLLLLFFISCTTYWSFKGTDNTIWIRECAMTAMTLFEKNQFKAIHFWCRTMITWFWFRLGWCRERKQ